MTRPIVTTNRRGLVLGGAALLTVPATARAQGTAQGAVIDIPRARTDPIPIAVPAMAGGGRGADIARVIQANLRNCGLFRPVDNAAFIQSPEAAAATPRFQDW